MLTIGTVDSPTSGTNFLLPPKLTQQYLNSFSHHESHSYDTHSLTYSMFTLSSLSFLFITTIFSIAQEVKLYNDFDLLKSKRDAPNADNS